MSKHNDFAYETGELRKAMRAKGYPLDFMKHARERQRERCISEFDIRQCLKAGYVVETGLSLSGRPVWKVEARVEGRRLHVVIADPRSQHCVVVVTAFWP